MRKVKSLILLFLVAAFAVTTVNATAIPSLQSDIQPRYVGVYRATSELTISSSGGAKVHTLLEIYPNYTAKGTATLYCDSCTYVESWDSSGAGIIEVQGTHYVASGHNYYVTLSATIYDSNGRFVDTVDKDSLVRGY